MRVEPRLLADFEGRWQITRSISHANAPPARFHGEAIFTPSAGGLSYEEAGSLAIQGQVPMSSSRRYLWKPDLTVWFEDGSFFHQVPPSGGQAAHWCDPDHYAVTYRFRNWPNFSVDWVVVGPRKDYRMRSQYVRLP
ncbi:MAG: DUF6314 family protein [Pseudomonadota bacterium]